MSMKINKLEIENVKRIKTLTRKRPKTMPKHIVISTIP